MRHILSHASQFASILQSARKQRKITQAQIALVIGASQPAVSRLELNPGNIKLSDFLRMCHVLGIEVSLNEKVYLSDQKSNKVGNQ